MQGLTVETVRYWTQVRNGLGCHFRLCFNDVVSSRRNRRRKRTYVLHDADNIVKVWVVRYDMDGYTSSLNVPVRLEAKQLLRKLEHLYPLHFMAKEWPRNQRIDGPAGPP